MVLERVNARFGTRFSPFDHSEGNVSDFFARIEEMHRARLGNRLDEKRIVRPCAARTELKGALKKRLEAPKARKLIT